jgi:hypothetical protein
MVCGTFTHCICCCGRAICGVIHGVTCWAGHLEALWQGASDKQPEHWPKKTK